MRCFIIRVSEHHHVAAWYPPGPTSPHTCPYSRPLIQCRNARPPHLPICRQPKAHCTLAPRRQATRDARRPAEGGALSPLKRLRGALAGEEIGNQLCGRGVQTPQQRILRVVTRCTQCVDFTHRRVQHSSVSVFITAAGGLWQTEGAWVRSGGRDRGRGRDARFGTVHDPDCRSAVGLPLGLTFRQYPATGS